MKLKKTISLLSAAVALCCGPALAASDSKPWMNSKLGAAERADLVIREMTLDEKLKLVFGYFGMDNEGKKYKRPQESYNQSAGFVYGVPRLGIPNLWQTDAGVGCFLLAGSELAQLAGQ